MHRRLPAMGMPARVYVKEHLNGHHSWRKRRSVARRIEFVPGFAPRASARQERTVWALACIRNEVEILPLYVDHLWRQGFDRLLVLDHLSRDGTSDLLVEMARRDRRIALARYPSLEWRQTEKINALAQIAMKLGAEWVVPVDADEFWFAEDGGTVAELLHSTSADIVTCRRFNALPLDGGDLAPTTSMAFSPVRLLPKVAFRRHRLALVAPGSHGVARVGGLVGGLAAVHVPYRSLHHLTRKFRDGSDALARVGAKATISWHWRAGSRWTDAEAASAWARMRAGESVPDVGWPGIDRRLTAQPLSWPSWDPERLLPRTDEGEQIPV